MEHTLGETTAPVLLADGPDWWRALRAAIGAERTRLVLFLPVAMGGGVAAYFGLRAEPPLWPVLAAVSVAAVVTVLAWRNDLLRVVALGLLAFSLGLLSCLAESGRALPLVALPRHATVVEGTVRAVDALPDGGTRLTISAASLDGAQPLVRTIRIRLRADDTAHAVDGERVRLRALLRAPASPAYPGAWDLQRDAFFSGLAGSGFALGDAALTTGTAPAGTGIAARWQALRDGIAERFEAGLPGPRGAIAATLIVGRSTAIAPADRAAFTNSGLAHLLAVAGLHIGIVMGLVLGLVRNSLACWPWAALRWPVRQIAAIAALAAGGLYLLLTGAHLPIVRSFCMAALATLGIAIGRRALSMRGLAVACAAILLLWPHELTGVSFQMSFSAVAALIAGYEVLRPVFAWAANGSLGRRVLLHLAGLALTSALAGTASAPFAAYHFGQVQIYFVLANLLAVPLTASWIMPWGLAALGLMPLGLEHLALLPMGWGIGAILSIGRAVSSWPAASFAVPHIPTVGLLLASSGIAVLCLLRTRFRLAGVPLIAAGLLSPAVTRPPDLLVSDDARLVAFADGDRLLIDKRSGASKFTIQEDAQYLATNPEPVLLPADGTEGPITCKDGACRLAQRGQVALLLSKPPPVCTGVSLVIAPFPLRDGCSDLPRIDRFTVWREGAQAVWLTSVRPPDPQRPRSQR